MKKIKKSILAAVEYVHNNPTESLTAVSKIFGVDRHTLGQYCTQTYDSSNLFENQANPEDDSLYYFTNEELELVSYYEQNSDKSYKSIKEKFPNAPSKLTTIRNWLDILGKKYFSGALIKYHYDRTKFAEIATEEDAYWLGFITADGCIVLDKILQIKLQSEDRPHLEKFCKYLGLNEAETQEIIKEGTGGAYTKDNPISVVKISSVEIVNNLKDKGIAARKSGNEIPYICASVELEKAYIRGLVDGDGYLRTTEFGFGIVGSQEICEYVKNFLSKNKIVETDTNSITEHGIIKKLAFGGVNKPIKIINYLYENANIYLDRKYNIYETKYKQND